MLRQYTDDPPADWDAYCREQDALHNMLPICCECGQRIEDDFCYEINDAIICEDCMDRQYKKYTMDLVV